MPSTASDIYLLTGPICSGKSTALLHWINDRNQANLRIEGILNLVVDKKKWFFNLATEEKWPMELTANDDEPISVGRYTFSKKAFIRANKALGSISAEADLIIIDELGKLELTQNGLHESVNMILRKFSPIQIILVVRDTLVNEVIDRYHLNVERILNTNDLKGFTINRRGF